MSARLRRVMTGLLVLFITWVPMVVAAAPASAHAVLVSTAPADGDLLATPPEQLTMTFSEPVEAGLATVRLFDPYGEQAQITQPTNPDGGQDTLAVAMPAQTFMGTYTVAWRVHSTDSHPATGAFTFHVGVPQVSVSPPTAQLQDEGSTAVGVLYGAARLLAFIALAVLVGLAFFVAAWWPAAGRYPAMGRLIWGSWAVLVVTTIAVLLLFGPQAAGRPLHTVADSALLSTTLQTRPGMALLARLLMLSLAAPVLALLLTRTLPPTPRQRFWRIGGVLGGAVVLAATWSIAGHSAVGHQTAIALPVDVVHLVAMGVWLGGLVALCGVLLRSRDVTAMRTAVPSFSRAAMICVVLLVVTGSYQGWRQVGNPTALTTTSYGWLLLGKLLLVIVLVGIGAASRSWVRRHYDITARDITARDITARDITARDIAARSSSARRKARRGPGEPELTRFRRMVTVETALAAVVLGVTAALVASQPARTAQLAAAAQQQTAQQQTTQQQAGQQAAGQQAGQQAAGQQWADPASPVPSTTRVGFDTGGPGGQGALDLAVFPATVGRNELHLTVLDSAGALLAVPEVTATLTLPDRAQGPLAVPLQQLGPGHYTGAMEIPLAGNWQLAVAVRTSEVDQDTVTTPVEVR